MKRITISLLATALALALACKAQGAGASPRRAFTGRNDASDFNYTTATLPVRAVPGRLSVLRPSWSHLPAGVGSGGFALVAVTHGSQSLRWVLGSKFNPNWVDKRATINGDRLTLASCQSTRLCLLARPFTGPTQVTTWVLIGNYTPVYLQGKGGGEAVAIAGVGPRECPGGGDLSVCVIAGTALVGINSLRSATSGIQEAANALAGPGVVRVGPGPLAIYAPAVQSQSFQTWAGAGDFGTTLKTTVAGIGTLVTLDTSWSTIRGFNILGGAGTGNGIARLATESVFLQDTFVGDRCHTGSAGLTGRGISGGPQVAACIYDAGGLLDRIARNDASDGGVGIEVVAAETPGGGPPNVLTVSDNDAFRNASDGIEITGGLSVADRHNTVEENGRCGQVIHASGLDYENNYHERDSYCELEITGVEAGIGAANTFQFSSPQAGYVVRIDGQSAGNSTRGFSWKNNLSLVEGPPGPLKEIILVKGDGIAIEDNVFDAITEKPVTIPHAIVLEAGGSGYRVAGNQAGPGGGSGGPPRFKEEILDEGASRAYAFANPNAITSPQAMAAGRSVAATPNPAPPTAAPRNGGLPTARDGYAKAVIAFPALGPGKCAERTVSVVHASAGDPVILSPASDPGPGITWQARAVADGVAVRICAPGPEPVPPSRVEWHILVVVPDSGRR